MSERTCENCEFFDHFDKRREWGYCRRNPPHVLPSEDGWPAVALDDWCGEFRAREDFDKPRDAKDVSLPEDAANRSNEQCEEDLELLVDHLIDVLTWMKYDDDTDFTAAVEPIKTVARRLLGRILTQPPA